MYIKRNIENKLIEASKQFASITIYGSRQVGKSTLIQHLFPTISYVTLDDIEIRDYAIRDPKGFIKYYSSPLVIDEIQKAPQLLEYIKIEIDNMKKKFLSNNEPLKFLYILSGSNQFELQEAITESLAGRTCVFNLSSLSYNEIKGRKSSSYFNPSIDNLRDKEQLLNGNYRSRKEIFEDIFVGGMPEYISLQLNRDMFFKSYITTYIEKDVKQIISATKETTFMNFMKYVALRTACQIDYTEISRSIGIDARTVKGWISILETSGIIKVIQPYASNISDRIIKTPKLYFMDTGLCAYLCGIPSADILEKSAFAGAFYETYVISEIIKSFYNAYKKVDDIYYYRDKDQHEVDLIIDSFDSIYPIEIKKGINPVSHTKKFTILKKYKKRINTGLVIDSSNKVFPINDEVYYCPIDIIGL
ncbi:MAG: ATP-binding protein [Acholeplasmatales bacterium]|jgi:predicted AAA+ superfamily ATPase|nr:ATP-binding protein [Acholeplasmatales bacterium]